jgi:hypothetical protein
MSITYLHVVLPWKVYLTWWKCDSWQTMARGQGNKACSPLTDLLALLKSHYHFAARAHTGRIVG